ncbi:hypothetical protein BDR22DRAFT_894103 [Usnea florida]
MAIRQVVSSVSRCRSCRIALLDVVAPYVVFSARPATQPVRFRIGARDRIIKQSFSSSPLYTSDLVHQQQQEQEPSGKDASLEEAQYVESNEIPEPMAPETPWYLQVEKPQRASNPLLERQKIPELPSDPPPLLKPMLEQISINLGLDDLTIFDLRKIDPPPALGANLIMILGTARSEKHLHVSADRFCGWLKGTYKLNPYADGLMGRGELKLKMRRKARRARLLSSVGSLETSVTDDGLRTGWICVNVGTIEDGRGSTEESNLTNQHDYVGFGSQAEGARVVIQMLTQEKREELDLEDLWGKTLRRHERKEGRISTVRDGVSAGQDKDQSSIHEELPDSGLSSTTVQT